MWSHGRGPSRRASASCPRSTRPLPPLPWPRKRASPCAGGKRLRGAPASFAAGQAWAPHAGGLRRRPAGAHHALEHIPLPVVHLRRRGGGAQGRRCALGTCGTWPGAACTYEACPPARRRAPGGTSTPCPTPRWPGSRRCSTAPRCATCRRGQRSAGIPCLLPAPLLHSAPAPLQRRCAQAGAPHQESLVAPSSHARLITAPIRRSPRPMKSSMAAGWGDGAALSPARTRADTRHPAAETGWIDAPEMRTGVKLALTCGSLPRVWRSMSCLRLNSAVLTLCHWKAAARTVGGRQHLLRQRSRQCMCWEVAVLAAAGASRVCGLGVKLLMVTLTARNHRLSLKTKSTLKVRARLERNCRVCQGPGDAAAATAGAPALPLQPLHSLCDAHDVGVRLARQPNHKVPAVHFAGRPHLQRAHTRARPPCRSPAAHATRSRQPCAPTHSLTWRQPWSQAVRTPRSSSSLVKPLLIMSRIRCTGARGIGCTQWALQSAQQLGAAGSQAHLEKARGQGCPLTPGSQPLAQRSGRSAWRCC